mgnify:FL=1
MTDPLILAAAQAHAMQLHRNTRWDPADGPRPQTGADWWAVLTDTDRAAAVAWVMPIVAAVLDAYILIDLPDQTCTACGLEHPGALCGQPTLLEVRP